MKKIFALILTLALSLSLASCTSGEDTGSESSKAAGTVSQASSAAPQVSSEAANVSNTPAEGATLESYLASIQDEIKAMEAAMAESGMAIKVTAKGNSLVYTYRFDEDLGENAEAMKAALNQTLEDQAATFEAIVKTMKAEIPSAESVIVEYLDKDGKTLASKEYK